MKIGIVINGIRGDVQPMLALACEFIDKGHEVVFCAAKEHEQLVTSHGCPFISFGPSYKEIFASDKKFKGGATTGPSPKKGKLEMINQIDNLPGIMKDCNIILGVGFVLGVPTVADYLKIPYRFVIFYPVLLGAAKSDPKKNTSMFNFGRKVMNLMIRGFINKKRKLLNLNPIKDVWQYWLGENVIVACDKDLNTAKEDVAFKFTQTAYMLLESNKTLCSEVENFINSGEPPIFISFGSNPISKPEKFAEMFKQVADSTKQRLIISKGWANLPENNSENILYVDEMPYEHLFPKLKAIVFHGGTGTMAAAARAGIPQIAFPFMADQFENGKIIAKLGLGPEVCDFNEMTAEKLINAINLCLTNENYKKNSVEMSQKINNSNGVEMTYDLIMREMV